MSEDARERAEKLFRHDDNKGNGRESMAEYQANAIAVREKDCTSQSPSAGDGDVKAQAEMNDARGPHLSAASPPREEATVLLFIAT